MGRLVRSPCSKADAGQAAASLISANWKIAVPVLSETVQVLVAAVELSLLLSN